MSSDSSQEAAAAIDQQMQGRFGLGTWDVIAVIAYFVVILSVGLIVSSKPKNNSISLINNWIAGARIKNRASENGSNGWGQSGRSLGVREYPWLCSRAAQTRAKRAF